MMNVDNNQQFEDTTQNYITAGEEPIAPRRKKNK